MGRDEDNVFYESDKRTYFLNPWRGYIILSEAAMWANRRKRKKGEGKGREKERNWIYIFFLAFKIYSVWWNRGIVGIVEEDFRKREEEEDEEEEEERSSQLNSVSCK